MSFYFEIKLLSVSAGYMKYELKNVVQQRSVIANYIGFFNIQNFIKN